MAIVAALFGIAAATATPPVAVFVRTGAQDGLSRRFESNVLEQFRSDPQFRLIDREAPGALVVSLPHGLGWERRLDWTSVSYQVRIDAAQGQSRIVTGDCWNWNLRICARQIVSAAAQDAGLGSPR